MNITKKRSFKMTVLAVVLIGILLTSQMMQAMANSAEPVAIVSNLDQLKVAIENAQDGDVIGVRYGLRVYSDVVIGDPNKHVILKRMTETSYIDTGVGNVQFQNITLDGGEINSLVPLVMVNYDVTFDNVTFRNSISKSEGGAVVVENGTAIFKNSLFENNRATAGGHIVLKNSATAVIANSILKDGQAVYNGGAIRNASSTATTTISSSIITGNSAGDYGGGLSNKGTMTFSGTKLYDNTAPNGADIGNSGNLNILDSIDNLVNLFKDDGIIPTAWINDYDGSTSLNDPDINPSANNALLKLQYEIPPTEVTLSPSSLGTASDGKIIGLESGKYYKITANDVVSYSKADGSLTGTESEASPLLGTEIIGLTNGEIYLVEEFTPAPTTVLLDAASLGTADNGKITYLSAGKMYKVSTDGIINYTKADGTLTTNESEAEALTGTEIIGLVNGVTYMVGEYIPPVEEEPTDPGTDPDPTDPTDPGKDEEVDADPDQESNTSTSTTTNTTTNSNNTSNTTNNTTNNSTTHNSDSRDDSSTVNNYDYSSHSTTENTYLPPSNDGSGEKGGQASASQHQTITVDYGSIVDGIKVQEDGKNITINVNVNVDTNEKEEAEPQAVEAVSSNVEAVQSSAASNITWTELVKICLLFGIFICVFRRPVAK